MSNRVSTKAQVINVGYHVGGECVGRQQIVKFAGQSLIAYTIRGKKVTQLAFLRALRKVERLAKVERRELDPAYE